jgi:hypothetical protein
MENLNSIKNNETLKKDIDSINLLSGYISEVLNLFYLNHSTLVSFKNLITNINNVILEHKGTVSTLIILERGKLLVIDKFNMVKEDLRKKKETEINNKNKSGMLINSAKEELMDKIKREIEDEEKRKTITEKEKHDLIIKCRSLKKKKENVDYDFNNDMIVLETDIHKIDEEFELSEDCLSLETNRINLIDNSIKLNRIEDIKSDFESNLKKNLEISDYYTASSRGSLGSSYFSNQSAKDDKLLYSSRYNTLSVSDQNDHIKNSYNTETVKHNFRDFAKIYLKVKFEKMNNTHRGQTISDKILWKQIKEQCIPYEKWTEFVLFELNNYKKYDTNLLSPKGFS